MSSVPALKTCIKMIYLEKRFELLTNQPSFGNIVYKFSFGGFPLALKSKSVEKRHKQSEVRRLRNKAAKSSARTCAKKFVAAVHAKDEALAKAKLQELCKELDTARGKGILTRNAVSRKKSRMMKLYNVSFAAAK